jgi:DNA-binding NarL/FixJ family response regulator
VQFTALPGNGLPGSPRLQGTEKKMNDAASSPVSVLLVDDHAVVREGYSRLLERHGDIKVIGEAGDADTAHSLFCCLDPQIVVMDISMPGTSGIEAMRRMLLFKPEARVLVSTCTKTSSS